MITCDDTRILLEDKWQRIILHTKNDKYVAFIDWSKEYQSNSRLYHNPNEQFNKNKFSTNKENVHNVR
jgi:hypothetical protein